jgi:hypothetical protein
VSNVIAIAIAALIQIESGGRPDAVGDGGRAVGILQMWPVAVREANRIAGETRWTLDDRRCPDKSIEMARTVLAVHYRRGNTCPVELAARWRNPYSTAPEWYRTRIAAAIDGRAN